MRSPNSGGAHAPHGGKRHESQGEAPREAGRGTSAPRGGSSQRTSTSPSHVNGKSQHQPGGKNTGPRESNVPVPASVLENVFLHALVRINHRVCAFTCTLPHLLHKHSQDLQKFASFPSPQEGYSDRNVAICNFSSAAIELHMSM